MRTWPALEVQQADADTRDLIQAFLTDFAVAAIDDNNPDNSSVVFFHDAPERDRAAGELSRQFPEVDVRAVDVRDEDWAARSQAALRAITVGTLVIAPPWDVPDRIPNPESRIPNPESRTPSSSSSPRWDSARDTTRRRACAWRRCNRSIFAGVR